MAAPDAVLVSGERMTLVRVWSQILASAKFRRVFAVACVHTRTVAAVMGR